MPVPHFMPESPPAAAHGRVGAHDPSHPAQRGPGRWHRVRAVGADASFHRHAIRGCRSHRECARNESGGRACPRHRRGHARRHDAAAAFRQGASTLGTPAQNGNIDIPRMREGGLDALFFSIWVPSDVTGPIAVKRALQLIDSVHEAVRLHPNDLVLATTAADIRRAASEKKIAALMGMEGGHMIDDDLRHAARLRAARRPLPDADPFQEQRLGRLLHRQAEAQRPDRLRQGRRARVEPPGRDGGHLARRGQDLLRTSWRSRRCPSSRRTRRAARSRTIRGT